MVTADQLVAHAVGDYVLQSDWMASRKRHELTAALVHAVAYSLPFLLFWPSATAFAVILGSHAVIDRYGLARYVVWAKNFLAPRWIEREVWIVWNGGEIRTMARRSTSTTAQQIRARQVVRNLPWAECQGTGYPKDRPDFMAVWLLIIADNLLHILVNGAALRWL